MQEFDVVIVGAGHAGCEAAWVASRMGARTLLLTTLIDRCGATSCNPAIGGLAKGHLVKELAALGGLMPRLADAATINRKLLNESKGAAVQGTRAQIDMDRYNEAAKTVLLEQKNLTLSQEMAVGILRENGRCVGVRTQLSSYRAKAVIITAGTFLNGLIHTGRAQIAAGRIGELPCCELGDDLAAAGLPRGRLKTGTCPRILASSIDFSRLERQESLPATPRFSWADEDGGLGELEHLPCFIAHTNECTHEIIRANMADAPLFSGQIKGVGPRYCPSIEDKINRFADKSSHHLFIEPQTKDAAEYYINGFSTSLDFNIQREMIQSVEGFERAVITRHGYAIEYDYFDPTALRHTLESKVLSGLYLAGQVNGTTGYEEAAAQGFMAAANAVLAVRGAGGTGGTRTAEGKCLGEEFILRRDEAYIGVMIDDLVTKGTKEPYRMFTSRAEYRLLLRESNAILRLNAYAAALGLRDAAAADAIERQKSAIERAISAAAAQTVYPKKELLAWLAERGEGAISQPVALISLLSRASLGRADALALLDFLGCAELAAPLDGWAVDEFLLSCKYYFYTAVAQSEIAKSKERLAVRIPAGFDYAAVSGLSNEIVEKLGRAQPATLEAAAAISGVTPAAIDILHIYLKTHPK